MYEEVDVDVDGEGAGVGAIVAATVPNANLLEYTLFYRVVIQGRK